MTKPPASTAHYSLLRPSRRGLFKGAGLISLGLGLASGISLNLASPAAATTTPPTATFNTPQTFTSTSRTITLPTGANAAGIVVVLWGEMSNQVTGGLPPGFTSLWDEFGGTHAAGFGRQFFWWKAMSAADSLSVTLSTLSASPGTAALQVIVISGADTTTPFDQLTGMISSFVAAGASLNLGSLTTTVDNELLIACVSQEGNPFGNTTWTGLTERLDYNGSWLTLTSASATQATHGTSVTVSAQMAAASNFQGRMVSIKPATVTTGGPATVDELVGCMYGGSYDYYTGTTVPYATNYSGSPGTNPPWGAHDGGRLPGYSAGQVDWSDGATAQTWPAYPSMPYMNAWNHAFLRSTERGCYFDFGDPAVYFLIGGVWVLQSYPSSDTSIWAGWFAPVWTGESDTVLNSRSTTPGGTPFTSVDMSTSTASNNYFVHTAWNHYWPRLNAGSVTAISVQFWARMRPKSGVDPATVNIIAGGSGDRFTSSTDSGNGANPALGIPRYKRLPTDSSWRLMGYTTATETNIRATPPPILAMPL